MPLTVLSVAYPLARVSESTAGGAEQVLLMLDKALVEHGERSLVIAQAGSRVHGLLFPVPAPFGNLDETAKTEARLLLRHAVDRAVERYPVDLIHMHGIDFIEYLPHCSVPILVTLHLPLAWYAKKSFQPRNQNIAFVCVSDSQASLAPPGLRIACVIPNGVDLSAFRPLVRRRKYVLFMGRICPEKGLHLAMQAAELAGETLLIAGSVFDYPEHKNYFETMIRSRLNGKARFIGQVGGSRKAHLLSGAKCLLLPSLAHETSSLIAMEALASGTPVIAWRSGTLPEIVCHGRTGFLVANVEEMAQAISRVDSLSRSECRPEAERRFSARKTVSAYFDLYRNLAQKIYVPELQAA